MTPTNRFAVLFASGFALAATAITAPAAGAQGRSARSATMAPPVVQLYTLVRCNSCPPADKRLLRLKADPSVVALAFHVDY